MVTNVGVQRRTVAAIVSAGLLASCGSGAVESSAGSGPTLVVTTSIWADVVDNVVCDGSANIVTLLPVGADPHGFEPSLADRADLDAASLVVANGLGLEELLEDTLEAVESDGVPVFYLGDHLDDEHGDDEHGDDEHGDDEDAHHHGGVDPHLWFDPLLVSELLPPLADALVDDAGLDRDAIDACVADYQQQLEDANAAVVELVDGIPADRRLLVTSHDSLGYFADRYGFEVVGTVSPAASGLAESNPGQLEALAVVAEERGVAAIFAESQRASDDAERLAERLDNIELVTLFTGSLGEPGSDADTYLTFLEVNAGLIADALR